MTNPDINIRVLDSLDVDPESQAMLCALYSRSNESIDNRINELSSEELHKKMKSFYVGYGHKSIGDCGNIAIFIENVSFIAAKAIQDNPLYNGQESSSRYIDFKTAKYGKAYTDGNVQLDGAISKLLEAYSIIVDSPSLKVRIHDDMNNQGLEFKSATQKHNAVNARIFDIARGFLPCGMNTQLAWVTSLSAAQEHLTRMFASPIREVRDIATSLYDTLLELYPSSFKSREELQSTIDYYKALDNAIRTSYTGDIQDTTTLSTSYLVRSYKESRRKDNYPSLQYVYPNHWIELTNAYESYVDESVIAIALDALQTTRFSRRHPIPRSFDSMLPSVKFKGYMDFASWRDLQRHRPLNVTMALPSPSSFMHQWYVDQLETIDEAKEVLALLSNSLDLVQSFFYEKIEGSPLPYKTVEALEVMCAYGLPMGMLVPIVASGTFSNAVYMLELRNTVFVHPTLRRAASLWSDTLNEYAFDVTENDVDIVLLKDDDAAERGNQTITEKTG